MDYTREEIMNILGNYLQDAQARGVKPSKRRLKEARKAFDNEANYIDEIQGYDWTPEAKANEIRRVRADAEAWRDQEALRRSYKNPNWIEELLSTPEGMRIAEEMMSLGNHNTAPVRGADGYMTPFGM